MRYVYGLISLAGGEPVRFGDCQIMDNVLTIAIPVHWPSAYEHCGQRIGVSIRLPGSSATYEGEMLVREVRLHPEGRAKTEIELVLLPAALRQRASGYAEAGDE